MKIWFNITLFWKIEVNQCTIFLYDNVEYKVTIFEEAFTSYEDLIFIELTRTSVFVKVRIVVIRQSNLLLAIRLSNSSLHIRLSNSS